MVRNNTAPGNVLDVEVSKYNGVNDTIPKQINLMEWLQSDHRAIVEKLRGLPEEKYKVERKQLPMITPSGIFKRRRESDLIKHSGLIQFDIDSPPNLHRLKQALKQIPYIAYCGMSTSGRGLWGVIPVSDPADHKGHFLAIEKSFEDMGVPIDTAPQNVASPRFASYDPEPYINPGAKVFPYKVEKKHRINTDISELPEIDKVEACIRQIEEYQIDITGDYQTWFQIGSALLGTFGESSRDWFHRISQFSPKYHPEELNQHWAKWIKAGATADIGVFYNACKDHGILFTNKGRASTNNGFNPWTGEVFDQRGYPADWDDV